MGKPQLAENPKAPAAGFVEDKLRFLNPEDVDEIQEELKVMEKQRQRISARANKVSKFLQDNFFRTDKTWPFLFWPVKAQQVSVRYYFPKKNLAVDQFMRPTKMDIAEVEFKKKVFKEKGIKYFPMMPDNRLLDLADYL